MTLVLLAGLSAGVLQDAHGNVIAGRSINVYARGTSTPVQVYADSAGSSPVTQPLTTNTNGQVPGYVAGGVSVDIVDALTGLRAQGEPVSANAVARTIATTYLTPSGGDDSAAMVAALATGGTIAMSPGTFLWNTSVPAFARSTPTRVQGAGIGKTTIKLSSGAPRAFDLNKVADYDTFSDIEISDLTIDCNNVGGRHHVVIGSYANGGNVSKINVIGLSIRRLRTINVPVDPATTDHRLNIYFVILVNQADTRCVFSDVVLEDLDFLHGGNIGVSIGGTTNDGSGQGNLFHDRIQLTRVNHDTLASPAQIAAATWSSENIQIGSKDTGGTVTIRDCHGFNSGDVGIAVLNGRHSHVEDCTVTDSRNGNFQAANFNPAMPADQQHIFRSCHAKVVNTNPDGTNYTAPGFLAGGGAVQQLGHVVIENCSWHSLGTNSPASGGGAIRVDAPVRSLEIAGDFHLDATSINHSLGGNYVSTPIYFAPPGVAAFTISGRLWSNVSGAITRNGFTFAYEEILISPPASADYLLDVDGHYPKISLSGVLAGTCYGALIGPTAIPGTTTVTGTTANTTGNVTALSQADIAKIAPGDPVTGTNIPASQTVKTVNRAAGSFVFGPSTASGSGSVTITVTPLACVRGRWRFDWQGDDSGDTAPIGVQVQKWGTPGLAPVASTFMSIGGHLSFDGSNASRMPVGSAGNGNVLGTEIVDTGNAANGMPLVTYQGIRPAAARQEASLSGFALANGATTINNPFGRRYQIWLSVVATAVTFARGSNTAGQAAFATSGPFYLEPGDQIVVTSGGGSWWRLPADM